MTVPPSDQRPDRPDRPSDSAGSTSADEPTRAAGTGSGSGSSSGSGAAGVVPLGPSIEGYVLKEELHRGGQGVVYRAVQLGTKRVVALKVLLEGPFASDATRQRFEREVELAASLRHPNIVTILDSGLSFGRYYFAMEYIDGIRLDRYLAQHGLSLDETLQLLEKVCLAVNFAHQRGVIHRDLKPANILIDRTGEPHVLDFGLAKTVQHTGADATTVQALSISGQLLGTVAYMSPEQAAGSHDVDVRSDVYSLGVIFYEALTGRPPYIVDGPLATVLQTISQDEPLNPRSLGGVRPNVRVDDELATILLKALDKEPQRRYQTAGEFARDLRHRRLGEPIEAKRASGLYMLRKTFRRYWLQTTMAGVVLLMLIGFLVAFAVLFTSERAARRVADLKSDEAELALQAQEEALEEARARTAEAIQAQQQLRRALAREHIQRGDLAMQRGDMLEARDSYWEALETSPGPAARWALRRYHLESSNSGSELLAINSHGPAVLARDARYTAACPTPRGILVRDVAEAQTVNWACVPDHVAQLGLDENGALAAAGAGWMQAWPARQTRPSVALRVPPDLQLRAVYPARDGNAILVVTPAEVRILHNDARGAQTSLSAPPTGRPDYSATRGLLVVPTVTGAELITIADGGLQHAVIWTADDQPVQAVRLTDTGVAVLADGLYHAELTAPEALEWERIGPPDIATLDFTPTGQPRMWELLDVRRARQLAIFASLSGRAGLIADNTPAAPKLFNIGTIQDMELSSATQSLVTLDTGTTLTRWIPPEQIEQSRVLFPSTPSTWASADDASTVLASFVGGRVVSYRPEVDGDVHTIQRPRLLGRLLGDEGSMDMDVSADGSRAFVRDGTTLRFFELASETAHAIPWRHPRLSHAAAAALSDDGKLVGLLVRAPMGDPQQIVFWTWPGDPDPRPFPFDFVGAEIRDLAFVPNSRELLVVRSNGQLFLLDPDERKRPPAISPAFGQEPPLEPWMVLHGVPVQAVYSRSGAYLAVAGADNVIRMIAPDRAVVRHEIAIPGTISAMSFNPRDDVLMVRSEDGTIYLCDPATAERIAQWTVPVDNGPAMACWVGQSDAMLLTDERGLVEQRVDVADQLVERSRPYFQQRQLAEAVHRADWLSAFAAANALVARGAVGGAELRLNTLEEALRQPDLDVPDEQVDHILSEASPLDQLRLAHAAYDGERFLLAQAWFDASATAIAGGLDAFSQQRRGACAYLMGDYQTAAGLLAEALEQPDADPLSAPTVALQRVAAFVQAEEEINAVTAAKRISGADRWGRRGDQVAAASARIIARLLLGQEERTAATELDDLLTRFEQRSLLYRDDIRFFAGELARQRGELQRAAVEYQRCIDLSRDVWPANWARYRLGELAQENAPENPA